MIYLMDTMSECSDGGGRDGVRDGGRMEREEGEGGGREAGGREVRMCHAKRVLFINVLTC